MSKITNDGLIRSGTGCVLYSCTHSRRQRVTGRVQVERPQYCA